MDYSHLEQAYNSPMTNPPLHPQSTQAPKLGEFELIREVFQGRAAQMARSNPKNAPLLGIGDDGAIISNRVNEDVVVTTDMLVVDRHFFGDADPYLVGKKSLAVNLSDLAAMGAKPTGFTLALALPNQKPTWLHAFANGLFDMANTFDCHLIGGDTCQGPLTISITALGSIPHGQAIQRSGAKPHDLIWVSGEVGDARLALGHHRKEWALVLDALEESAINQRLHCPLPRVQLGLTLRGIASAALDISDGLLGDLSHILEASNVSAVIDIDALPCSPTLRKQALEIQYRCAASGGDDYELCFTTSPNQRARIETLSKELALPLTCIGEITERRDANLIVLHDRLGQPLAKEEMQVLQRSFDHFKD